MTVRSRTWLRLGSLALLLSLFLSACSAIRPLGTDTTGSPVADASIPAASASTETSAAAAPSAAATASSAADAGSGTDEAAITAGIQETLDTYARAFNENDPSLLAQVVDPKNGPMKRFVQTRFDTYQSSIFAGQRTYAYSVRSLERRPNDFVTAEVEYNGFLAGWTFKQVGGKWLMSEPTEKQLGEREKVETEHFIFYMYPWTDEYNETLMQQMENARTQVEKVLGKVPDSKADVYIKPTFGVGATTGANTLAFYSRQSRGNDRMVIIAPNSYVFPFYDEQTGWEPDLQETVTHEYTHLVNNQSFTPIARMSDWMVEGLAEFVSSPTAIENRGVPQAVQSDQIIPIIDPTDRINKQDLQHLTILEQDISLAYGLSTSLVKFIVDKHGGLDGFWKLVDAYDKSQNLDTALQQAFGISYEQFDQEWRAWLKETYG